MNKFKAGDKVKVVKKGSGEHSEQVPGEFENSWVSCMDGAFEKEFIVKSVGYKGVYFEDCVCGMGFPPAALELVKDKHEYKEGDKIVFLHVEEYNKAYDNEYFTVGKTYELTEQESEFYPDHVRVIANEGETAYARKDQVKLVQEEKTEETVNLFKVGDKVRLVHPELATEKCAEPSFFPSVGTVQEVSEEDADWPWIRVEGSFLYWPTSALDLVKEEAQVEAQEDKVEKYTVAEVFEALNEMDEMYLIHMTGEVEAYLKKKQDPEWEEYKRLSKKFED